MERLKNIITNKEDRKFYSHCLNEGMNFESLISLYELTKKNERLLKNNNIKASDYIQSSGIQSLTNFSNDVTHAITESSANKMIRRVFSNKYKHLINERTREIFFDFAANNIDVTFFDQFQKKIAAFYSPNELNESLEKSYKQLIEWSMPTQKSKIMNQYTNIISEDNNSIIFEVNDYNACKSLGTDMWCIVRESDTFDSYREDFDRIFFKYNFNENPSHINSMTAYVVRADGSVVNGYFKDDSVMEEKDANLDSKYFTAFDYSDFEQRIEDSNYSDVERQIVFYKHNFQHLIEGEENVISERDFIDLIESRKLKSNAVLNLLKDFEELNTTDIFDSILDNLSNNYSNDHFYLLDYIASKNHFENRNIFDAYSQVYGIDYSNEESRNIIKNTINNYGRDLNREVVEFFCFDKTTSFSPISKFITSENINLLDELKKHISNKEIFDVFNKKNKFYDLFKISKYNNTLDDLADFIIETRSEQNDYLNKIVALTEHGVSFENKNVGINVKEEETARLKSQCLKDGNRMFLLKRKLISNNVSFNYDESLHIINQVFFNVKSLDEIDEIKPSYLIEDFIEPNTCSINLKILKTTMMDTQALIDFHKKVESQIERISNKKGISQEDKDKFVLYCDTFKSDFEKEHFKNNSLSLKI